MMLQKLFPLLTLILFLGACSETSNSNQPESPGAAEKSPTGEKNSQAPAALPALIGEWEQKFSSMDRNDDGELQESEKVPAEYKMGFNYFEFRENGECFRDSDLKLPGTYEVKAESGEQVLYIHNTQGMMVETYRYSIESLSENELVLSKSGAFLIFTRK